MDSFVREKLHNEKSYRIRCMKSLIEQLKKDYSNLSSQNSSSFRATSINNCATTFCGHASTKTMCTFTFNLAWLKGAFHCSIPVIFTNISCCGDQTLTLRSKSVYQSRNYLTIWLMPIIKTGCKGTDFVGLSQPIKVILWFF